MLEQENDPDLDGRWLNVNYRLIHFSNYIDQIVGRVKGSESPYVQGTQYYEEYLVI